MNNAVSIPHSNNDNILINKFNYYKLFKIIFNSKNGTKIARQIEIY